MAMCLAALGSLLSTSVFYNRAARKYAEEEKKGPEGHTISSICGLVSLIVNGEEFEIRNCFAGLLFCVSSE